MYLIQMWYARFTYRRMVIDAGLSKYTQQVSTVRKGTCIPIVSLLTVYEVIGGINPGQKRVILY